MPKHVSVATSDDSDDEAFGAAKPSVAAPNDPFGEQPVESMDVDLDHPDEGLSDPGEDQEIVPGFDEDEISPSKDHHILQDAVYTGPSKRNDIAGSSIDNTAGRHHNDLSSHPPISHMQEYIRATHGLPLEEIRLHYIPLKATILGRALDWTVLQRITLLDVGSQVIFWAMLSQLSTSDYRISFKSIHTDHVTTHFAKYLATFHGLEELFLHERNVKGDSDSERSVDINQLRKVALSSHVSSLKRLMLRNEKDDSWDMDDKMLQFLALKGRKTLRELACTMKMPTYVSYRPCLKDRRRPQY